MRKKELLGLSFKLWRRNAKSFIPLIIALVFALLLFFYATSLSTSVLNILNGGTSYHLEDYHASIRTLDYTTYQPTYHPISDQKLDKLILEQHPYSLISRYSDSGITSFTSFNLNGGQRIFSFSYNFIDPKYDTYDKKQFDMYETNSDFIIKGRDLVKDDRFGVLINQAVLDRYNETYNLNLSFEKGLSISVNYEAPSGKKTTLQALVIGVFHPAYGLTRQNYQDNLKDDGKRIGVGLILASDILSTLIDFEGASTVSDYRGQSEVLVVGQNLSQMVKIYKYLQANFDRTMFSLSYISKREYLLNLAMGINILLVLCLLIFLVCLFSLVNNMLVIILKRIKSIGFMLSIGMKKSEVLLLYLYQNIIILSISMLLAFVVFSASFGVLENFIKSTFGYYFNETDHFYINYPYIVIGFLLSLFFILIASVLPFISLYKKQTINLMKKE
jgi:ABC-type antimicrobial peptide transport system permease subunit